MTTTSLHDLPVDPATLPPRQREVFQIVLREREENRPPPTLREIGDELGITASTVEAHVRQLERRGMVSTMRGKSRTLMPVYA
jgi:DNA-binding MarR family transcriptional regulator